MLIKNIKVNNANALSSPYTIGMPSITSFLGFSHALQLKVNDKIKEFKVKSCGIAIHDIDLQTYKNRKDYHKSILGISSPLKKDGTNASFVEDPTCKMNVSLLIEYSGINKDNEDFALQTINSMLHCMKLSSGDIISFKKPEFICVIDDKSLSKLMKKIMPSNLLTDRSDLINYKYNNFDEILDYLVIKNYYNEDDKQWKSKRKESGWLIPISIGYKAISDVCIAKNQRCYKHEHRFAESLITICECIMSYKIDDIDDILWHHENENDLYICKTNN